jgi:hypothetical protein
MGSLPLRERKEQDLGFNELELGKGYVLRNASLVDLAIVQASQSAFTEN